MQIALDEQAKVDLGNAVRKPKSAPDLQKIKSVTLNWYEYLDVVRFLRETPLGEFLNMHSDYHVMAHSGEVEAYETEIVLLFSSGGYADLVEAIFKSFIDGSLSYCLNPSHIRRKFEAIGNKALANA